ncbi:MAG TPA: N-acetylglucosamine-6-phosphate deacetylase [Dermatophilaceae bacterium]|nr:N-acetylglucosamine-6-phosphate deacetylase [Dermatophilaceae bacterium]
MLIAAPRLLTPDRVLEPGFVETGGERVVAVGSGMPPRPPDVRLTGTVVPGFVDIHCHGGGGASFTDGSGDAARVAAAAHLAHGTTTVVASLVTDTVDRLAGHLAALAPLVDEGVLAGLHLEGPWLSPRYAGAHDRGLLTAPRAADIERLVAAASGTLRMVTLAPELPGGIPAVARLAELGVTPAVGHTDATYAQAREAVAAGARMATHLFNAMRPLHHREPGPALALLEDQRVHVELVADGVHLHPAYVRNAAAATPGRFLLVTDAMAAAAAADGRYALGPMLVEVRDGRATLVATGAIAGSTLTMAGGLRYAVQVAGVPLAEAVAAATARPAAALGLAGVGHLEPGALADLVVLDDDLAVTRVLRRGAFAA